MWHDSEKKIVYEIWGITQEYIIYDIQTVILTTTQDKIREDQ